MKQAGAQYIAEEKRLYGAIPKIMAEILPFDVDIGLAPGSGTFVNCSAPSSDSLLLDEGYTTSGSWTSDIRQTYLGQLSKVKPTCTNLSGYNSSSLYVRSGASFEEAIDNPWVRADWGSWSLLEAFYQLKIVLADFIRAWAVDDAGDADGHTAYAIDGGTDAYLSYAVDGEFPGRLSDIRFIGAIEIDEEKIIDCQNLIVNRPMVFSDILAQTHVLTIDNRERQWIPGHQNFLMADGLWYGKEIHIYTGFELPTGEISWVKQYVGLIKDITDITTSFGGKHQAKIKSSLMVHEKLNQLIGAPKADGTRNPFISGYYLARAEITSSTDPYLGEVTKDGLGSAMLVAMGTPSNHEDVHFLIEAETTGEVSVATFRWSIDNGASWEKAGIVSMTSANPFTLRHGVMIYFVPGVGTDLEAGDRFSFTAYARRTVYTIPGGPFDAITNVYHNGVEMFNVPVDLNAGSIELIGPSGFVDARVVKSATTNPVDIISDIMDEVGLSENKDSVSFSNAKQALADYQIGVRFEGFQAWKAIQYVCQTCLIFFWIEADKAYLSAYTGDS